MERLDAPKLIEFLLRPAKRGLWVYIADDRIYQRLLEEQLAALKQGKPQQFTGKGAIFQCVDSIATGSLFAPPVPSLILLPEKFTKNQWEEESRPLERLGKELDTIVTLLAPTSLRETIKSLEKHPACRGVFLSYSPSDAEAVRCLEQLSLRYPSLRSLPRTEVARLCGRCLEYYSNDLLACDLHFERMEKGGLDFESALAGQTEVTAFDVVDALTKGDKGLLELRLQQCLLAGEDAGSIFMAALYVLKQLTGVFAYLEKGLSAKSAFQELYIQFPAQARLLAATKTIDREALLRFLIEAARLELKLRTQKNAHSWLYVELSRLIR